MLRNWGQPFIAESRLSSWLNTQHRSGGAPPRLSVKFPLCLREGGTLCSKTHMCRKIIILVQGPGPPFHITLEGGPGAVTHFTLQTGGSGRSESRRLESARFPSGGSHGPGCGSGSGGREGRGGLLWRLLGEGDRGGGPAERPAPPARLHPFPGLGLSSPPQAGPFLPGLFPRRWHLDGLWGKELFHLFTCPSCTDNVAL